MVTQGSIEELRAHRQPTVFEVEVEEDPGPLARSLAGLPWVKSMDTIYRKDRQVFRVDVSDVDVAKRELPRLAYESGLTLLRYELASASLEDIFMELVGEQEATV